MSQPLAEPERLPPATEQQVRARAAELVARHGITGLAFASPGRLRGHVSDGRDLFDMFEFQRAATGRPYGFTVRAAPMPSGCVCTGARPAAAGRPLHRHRAI